MGYFFETFVIFTWMDVCSIQTHGHGKSHNISELFLPQNIHTGVLLRSSRAGHRWVKHTFKELTLGFLSCTCQTQKIFKNSDLNYQQHRGSETSMPNHWLERIIRCFLQVDSVKKKKKKIPMQFLQQPQTCLGNVKADSTEADSLSTNLAKLCHHLYFTVHFKTK